MDRPFFLQAGIIENFDRNNPGLLEYITKAIEPLTGSGEYQLGLIETETYYYETIVRLESPEMDILFRTTFLLNTSIQCFFNVHRVKKTFSGEFLFPAINIPIQLKKGEPSKGLFFKHYSPEKTEAQNEIESLIEGSGFIFELNRLCCEIKRQLQVIGEAFGDQAIDKTLTLYASEYDKNIMKPLQGARQ